MSVSNPPDHLISLSMSADEAMALRHLLVWLDGIGGGRSVTPEAFAAQFTAGELEILAGLRRVFLEHDFRAARRP
jgi:hypothetical protein